MLSYNVEDDGSPSELWGTFDGTYEQVRKEEKWLKDVKKDNKEKGFRRTMNQKKKSKKEPKTNSGVRQAARKDLPENLLEKKQIRMVLK